MSSTDAAHDQAALDILVELEIDRVFSTAHAEQAGIPSLRLTQLARRRRLTHLTRGYWSTTRPETPEEAHLLTTLAILRRHVRASAATAHSALVLRGLPVVGCDLSLVHVQRDSSPTTRHGRDFTIHVREATVTPVTRPPVVTEDVLCVDLAAAIVLTGVLATPGAALVAADAAVRQGLVTVQQVEMAAGERYRGAKGISLVRRALADVDGRRESPGESLTAQVCAGLGFELEPQVWVGPWRVDFVVKGTKVIIEFDGMVKYGEQADLVAEKRREDDLRARGYVVVRLVWADLHSPARVRAKVETGLRAAA